MRNNNLYSLIEKFTPGIGQVLMFHRVYDRENSVFNKYLQVTPEFLEKVIKYYISRNIEIVSLDECHKRIVSKERKRRFVAFTLDDGYADNLTHALPVFEKYNAPFTIFLATGYPDQKVILWWYLIEDLILKHDSISFSYESQNYSFITLTKDEKEEAFWKIRRFIMNSEQENLEPRLKAVLNDNFADLKYPTKKLALSWEQVAELSNHPLVTIGAHTVNHLALSKLTEKIAIEEVNDSIKIIKSKTGKDVSHLAYPLGSSSEAGEREFNIARNCGLKLAFTAINGNIYRHHSQSLFSLPRIAVDENWNISYGNPYFIAYANAAKRVIKRMIGNR